MSKLLVSKVNEVYLKVSSESYILRELSDHFRFRPEGYQFHPSFKNRLWDGYVKLFNQMDCTLPIGLLNYLMIFCEEREYEIEIASDLVPNNKLDDDTFNRFVECLQLPFELRDYQINGIKKAISQERLLLLSPTGSGKSLTIYCITRWFNKKTLIIVPTLSLIHQMQNDFKSYSINDKSFDANSQMHLVYGGQEKATDKTVVVSTWQSIYKLQKNWFDQFDVVICDEAHLGKSDSITSILKKLSKCPIRIGTTGTLDGSKVNQLILEGYLGPVYSVTSTKELISNKVLAQLSIKCICLKYSDQECQIMKKADYKSEIKYIIQHQKRNTFIVNMVKAIKNNVLVLFEFVDDHGLILHEMIKRQASDRNVYLVYGNTPAEEREKIREMVEKDRTAIIVASVKVFSTGVNIRNLDSVIFVSPTKSRIRSLQSIGRVLRIGDHSNKAFLYDIVDDFSYNKRKNYTLKHFIERAKIYDSEKFDYTIHKVKL